MRANCFFCKERQKQITFFALLQRAIRIQEKNNSGQLSTSWEFAFSLKCNESDLSPCSLSKEQQEQNSKRGKEQRAK